MLGQLVGPDIVELIASRQFGELRAAIGSLSPDVVAEIFTDMSPEDVAVIFRVLPREFAADIFEYLPFETQEDLLHSLGQEQVASVLDEMAPDDRTALLEELPGAVTQRLLTLLSPDERRIATQLLGYPPESIGRRMTPDYVAVRADWTVAQVLEHIRKVGRDKETLNVMYVTDERGRLLDDIRLRELVLADPATRLIDMMDRQFYALRADQDQEEAVKEFSRLDRVALPVVDSTGLLVGMVTVDDVLDVVQEEVTEDVQKMAAVEALDAPYLTVSLATMVRKRVGWLALLLLGQMVTVRAVRYFGTQIDRAIVLSFLMPLILSSGGNSGSQTASLVIRALSTGELHVRDWLRVLLREVASGLALGSMLALIAALAFLVIPPGEEHVGRVALTVGLALISVVVYGTFLGAMLPLVLSRLGFDPAVSSTPFVATIADASGIVIYFAIAMLMLRGTLL